MMKETDAVRIEYSYTVNNETEFKSKNTNQTLTSSVDRVKLLKELRDGVTELSITENNIYAI